jgi:hypothetical protein
MATANRHLSITLATSAALLMVGGGELPDDDTPPADGACDARDATWNAPDFASNAAGALSLRGALDNLTGSALMRGAEQQAVDDVDAAKLTAGFDAGAPSLADAVSPAFGTIVEDAFGDFVELLSAGPIDIIDDTLNFAPGLVGGVAGTDQRGINAGGIEVRQLLDKGLFGGAALYRYATQQTTTAITPPNIEAIAAAYGVEADLALAEEPQDSSKYTYAMGYHADMVQALTEAHDLASRPECEAARDAAVVRVFRTWEKALLARFVYYTHASPDEVAAAVDDDDYISALHELSEGIGLAAGFFGLDNPAAGPLATAARLTTDDDILGILGAVGVNLSDLSASTTGAQLIGSSFSEPQARATEVVLRALDIDAAEAGGWVHPSAR